MARGEAGRLDREEVYRLLGESGGSYRLETVARTGSTNRDLLEASRRGAPAGTVLVADRQSRGRGRRSRHWASPPGGLYASLLLRPEETVLQPTLLPLAAGLAAADAIEALSARHGPPMRPRVKWPNDLLVEGAKLGGILVESEMQEGRLAAVVGIGINLEPLEKTMELDHPATSLAEASPGPWRREPLLAALLEALEEALRLWREDPPALRRRWEERSGMMGRPLRVRTLAGPVEGTCLGLAESGALRLRSASGEEVEINSAEGIEVG
jgi:BirA family biotin operon repressor/biotin-[acetyl-CoA-carboxylase] ligase